MDEYDKKLAIKISIYGGNKMDFNEYQINALRTASMKDKLALVHNGVMGLAGESGECIDLMKKHLFQGHELNSEKMIDELGDVLWYVAITAEGLGVSLEEVATHNVDKLKKRYPEGFDSARSINRE